MFASLALGTTLLEAAGRYEPVSLNRKERRLLETSAELQTRFERRSLLYSETALLGLVEQIGRALSPEPVDEYIEYGFYLLHDPSPNAFALPNGDVYIHTGLLARLADRSQLAAVIAHEIAHVAGHHGIIHYRNTHGANTASTVLMGQSVFGRDAWWMWNDMIAVGLHTSLYGFGRVMEQEADEKAIELLTEHGFDPHALPEVLEVLSRDLEGLNPRLPTVWSDRTALADRALNAWADAVYRPAVEREGGDFQELLFPLRVMSIRDYIEDDYPNTALALTRAMLEKYPDRPEIQALLGDGWRTLGPRSHIVPGDLNDSQKRRSAMERVRTTRAERTEGLLATPEGRAALASNLVYAVDAYEAALGMDPDYAPAYRGLGESYELMNAPREAAAAYLNYVKLARSAPDRAIVIERLKSLRDRLQGEEDGRE